MLFAALSGLRFLVIGSFMKKKVIAKCNYCIFLFVFICLCFYLFVFLRLGVFYSDVALAVVLAF